MHRPQSTHNTIHLEMYEGWIKTSKEEFPDPKHRDYKQLYYWSYLPKPHPLWEFVLSKDTESEWLFLQHGLIQYEGSQARMGNTSQLSNIDSWK